MDDDFPDDFDWGDQLARGAAYAARRAKLLGVPVDGDEAKAIAREAVCQAVAAGWDRTRYPNIGDLVGSRINGLVVNRSRKKATRAEVADQPRGSAAVDPRRSPEEVAADRHLAQRATTLMLDRLDGNDVAVKVFLAMAEGADGPADIAAVTEIPVQAVYRARERIADVRDAVVAELRKELDA